MLTNQSPTRMHASEQHPAPSMNALLFRFVKDGWIDDPRAVKLPSFSKADIHTDDVDVSGDPAEHNLFAWDRCFPSGRTMICTEFKLYFYGNVLRTNGIGIVGKLRVTAFLSYLKRDTEKNTASTDFSFQIYMNKTLDEGAILFRNGVMIQFAAQDGERNFYMKTVESGVDLTDEHAAKLANTRFVNSLFSEFSCKQWDTKKRARHIPMRKLCAVIS